MSKEELLQFAKDEFKKIFGDKYDESRAIACVETQLKEKDSIEKAEEAVKAIISRTASKMENFDNKPGDFTPGKAGSKLMMYKDWNEVKADLASLLKIANPTQAQKDKINFLRFALSHAPKTVTFDFKPVITDGKKELVVDDDALVLDGKVVKKFDPKTTSLMDVVEMAQKILHTDKLKSTFKKFDDLKQALADAPAEIKENFNTLAKYFDEKSKLNVNFPKWMLKLGDDTYEVESDGSVKINGEKKDWKVSLTEPLQKILNIFAVKHNEARLNQNPSLTLHDAMEGLKEMLFDAPAEVKQDFNTLVKYFDSEKNSEFDFLVVYGWNGSYELAPHPSHAPSDYLVGTYQDRSGKKYDLIYFYDEQGIHRSKRWFKTRKEAEDFVKSKYSSGKVDAQILELKVSK